MTLNFAVSGRRLAFDQPVVEPLMIALFVKVSNVLRRGSPQRSLSEEDKSVEALLIEGSHEAFGESVQVRTSSWQFDVFVPEPLRMPMNWGVYLPSRS